MHERKKLTVLMRLLFFMLLYIETPLNAASANVALKVAKTGLHVITSPAGQTAIKGVGKMAITQVKTVLKAVGKSTAPNAPPQNEPAQHV